MAIQRASFASSLYFWLFWLVFIILIVMVVCLPGNPTILGMWRNAIYFISSLGIWISTDAHICKQMHSRYMKAYVSRTPCRGKAEGNVPWRGSAQVWILCCSPLLVNYLTFSFLLKIKQNSNSSYLFFPQPWESSSIYNFLYKRSTPYHGIISLHDHYSPPHVSQSSRLSSPRHTTHINRGLAAQRSGTARVQGVWK